MKLINRYLDKWISRKALAILTHKLAMCGYKTIIEEKDDYYNISLKRYKEKDEKPKYFFTLNVIDGLEFYLKWYEMNDTDIYKEVKELFDE